MAYHHGNLKQALVEAAIPLLAEKGISGLSLREVARSVGVGHAAPYRHFSNKNELIEAIAAVGYRRLGRGCELAEKKFPDDPQKQLLDGGLRYLLFAAENPEIANIMFNGYLSLDSCGAELSAAADDALTRLVKIIGNGQAAGIYGDSDSFDLTLAAWSMVHGLSMLVVSGMLKEVASSRKKIRQLGEKVCDMLMHGMLKQK